MSEPEIECSVHGLQPVAYVCRHILESLHDRRSRGFWCESGELVPRPDAWCTECNEHLRASGGVWTDEAKASVDIALLCGRCYDDAQTLNGSSGDEAFRQFAEVTRRVIGQEGFDEFQPTAYFPARLHLAVWEDVPNDANVGAIAMEWAFSKAKGHEEVLVAFKVDEEHFKIVRRAGEDYRYEVYAV